LTHIIALKTISSTQVSETTGVTIYFQALENKGCDLEECKEYSLFVTEPAFFDFLLEKKDKHTYVIYYGNP